MHRPCEVTSEVISSIPVMFRRGSVAVTVLVASTEGGDGGLVTEVVADIRLIEE